MNRDFQIHGESQMLHESKVFASYSRADRSRWAAILPLRLRVCLGRARFAAVGLLAIASVSLASAQPIPTNCQRFKDAPPAWLFSGSLGTNEVVLIDSLHSKGQVYSLDGHQVRELDSWKSGAIQINRPTWIRPAVDGGYFAEDEDGTLVLLDANYTPKEVFANLLSAENSEGQKIGSIWNWQVSNNKEYVLAFGDIRAKDGKWSSGFMLIPVEAPNNFQVFGEMELSDPAKNLYVLGNSYIAAINDKFFLLSLKGSPAIQDVTLPSRKVKKALIDAGIELKTTKRVQLPEKRGASSVAGLFDALEKASIPSGLFAWRNSLYVLLRKPLGNQTQWSLAEVNPNTGELTPSRPLKTSANHLVVIPGREELVLIEKGPVRGLGEQTVLSICRIFPRDL